MPIYDKPVRLLMREMATGLGLTLGQSFSRDQAVEWFAEHYPKIKEGTISAHLIRLSTNTPTRLHYSLRTDGSDDLFFKIDGSHFRLYDAGTDPAPISSASPPSAEPEPDRSGSVPGASGEFAYEHDLRDYVARNLHILEPSLRLYSDDEGITDVEFPVGGRFIDILAVDQSGGYVVIEFKVSKGYDRTVGQLLRYVSWIKQHHAEPGKSVRGIIVAKQISEDLRLACTELPTVSLYEYDLSVTVRRVVIGKQ